MIADTSDNPGKRTPRIEEVSTMAAPGLKVADTPEAAPAAAGGTAPGTPEDTARSTAGDFAEETPFEAATAAPFDRPAYLSEALEDAERLLRYVAEAGIAIDGRGG